MGRDPRTSPGELEKRKDNTVNWLNPVNWFRAAAASAVDKKIDEYLTQEKVLGLAIQATNAALDSADGWWTDEKCRKMSHGLAHAGNAAIRLSEAIDPEGQQGKGLSPDELRSLLDVVRSAFGNLLTEEDFASWRKKAKEFVRKKIGL